MQKALAYILLIFFLTAGLSTAQDDAYYSALNTSLTSFVYNLKTRIRSPYTQVSYANYTTTNIPYFASLDNGDGTRTVYCVYSGYAYVYTPPFTWEILSREHTFCYSWMPNTDEGAQCYSDQYHLFPTHQNSANGVRSNHPLGIVNSVISTFLDSKYGTNTTGDYVYEPRGVHKGDAARALLYMCIKYDSVGGYVWNFNFLDDRLASLGEGPQDFNTLLLWHQQDPPDKWEVSRNNYIQTIQQNRNPLVDHPEYVYYIDFSGMTKLSPSYSAEPDNYVTGFSADASDNSITLTWTDAAPGTQSPSGYLLEAYSTDNYFIPIDGNTYTDDADLSDGKAVVNIDYSAANTYTFSGLSPTSSYYFRMYSYNGTGALRNYKITGTVPAATGTTSAVLSPEPSNYVSGLTAGNIKSNSISIYWTDALPGAQAPSGYLMLANNTNTFTAPVDGTVYPDDVVLSDGSATVNVNYEDADSAVFASLASNTYYYFRIYSYNGTGTSRNYKIDGEVPNTSAKTLTGGNSSASLSLLDNFNRTNSNTAGNTPTITSLTWAETETASGTGIQINTNRLQAGSTTAGIDYASVNLSLLNSYPVTLSASGYTIQWAFNFRQSRSDPSGFDASNYGIAFILGMNSPDASASSGYAVVLGQSGSVNALRLVSFSGGLDLNSNITDIISSGNYGNKYLSVRVTYTPSTNAWSLFADSSSGGFPLADPRMSVTQLGVSTVNSAYTGTALSYLACLWRHNTSSSDNAVFDDIYITDPGGVLPVILTSFTSSVKKNSVRLNWSTENESFNKGFEVYRIHYPDTNRTFIGFIQSSANSGHAVYTMEDRGLQTGKYKYLLKQIDFNGNYEYFDLNGYVEVGVPNKYDISQNYPNPFNPVTKIDYDLPFDSKVSLRIYDVTGREVKNLFSGDVKAGYYTQVFDASSLSSGVYFYRVVMSSEKAGFVQSKKMVVLK